jgi:hypothetical protein
MTIGSFLTLSAQTTPEKHLKTTELNEVAIIKTKSVEKSRSNHFFFFGQPSLNTGSVLEG